MTIPEIIREAWNSFEDNRTIQSIVELSPRVSTNQVFRLTLDDDSTVIAKTSTFGTFEQSIDDHERIQLWARSLEGTRFNHFLAGVLEKDSHVFSFFRDREWVIFYQDVSHQESLPRVLQAEQIDLFAREIASFHRDSEQLAENAPSIKSVKTDIVDLAERIQGEEPSEENDLIKKHCETFLRNIEHLGYTGRKRIPLLIDWNIGNFSIESAEGGFKLSARWDYDWFRVEPFVFDFYFCSRVVSAQGDKTEFSYLANSFLEPRFHRFLACYHALNPLTRDDIFMLREVYRFFILNYVIKDGMMFFRRNFYDRLRREAVTEYLPRIDAIPFETSFSEVLKLIG